MIPSVIGVSSGKKKFSSSQNIDFEVVESQSMQRMSRMIEIVMSAVASSTLLEKSVSRYLCHSFEDVLKMNG